MLGQALPFSIRGAMRQNASGGSMFDQALSFWGFVPAPQSITNPARGQAWQQRQDVIALKRRMKEREKMGLPQ
jgi:hypothetical protein